MSSHFFTNHTKKGTGVNLVNKFEGVFKHMHGIHNFEAVIGYFRSSGYFMIRPFLEKIPVVKILVGINVDKLVSKAHSVGLEYIGKADDIREIFKQEAIEDIKKAAYSAQVEEGIINLISDITSGKVQIRAFKSDAEVIGKTNLHCKIYIFTQEKEHTHAGWGSVITGSSNLSFSGLKKNVEFNVELNRYDDVKYAKDFFEYLWENETVDILPIDIEKLKTETHLNPTTTPFELYIKLLITYFGKNIDIDHSVYSLLPKHYDNLAYQAEAVDAGMRMLEKHHGLILADVVGLGKTVVASMIIKKYIQHNGHNTKVLIIYPPALANNWKTTIRDFSIDNYVDYVTNGSLHKIIDADNSDYQNPENYDLIVVDESHKFRNDSSQMYALLQMICKTPRRHVGTDKSRKKKVMLLSATPLNNRPEDIANQIYLFQDARSSTIEGVLNLQSFFASRIKAFKNLDKNDEQFIEKVKEIYAPIREKILTQLVIRRTRADIKSNERWWSDMQKQDVTFPDIIGPNNFEYKFDSELNTLFHETADTISNERIGFQYFRYRAIEFLKPEYQEPYDNANLISARLAAIMRTMLIKRLESSFTALKSSLKNFSRSNANMINMFEKGKIFIAPDLDVNKYINEGREDELEEIIAELNLESPNHDTFSPNAFEDGFLQGLKADQVILEKLIARWEAIDKDPKLDKFLEKLDKELMDDRNTEKKLVIFTESTKTADYLKDELHKHGHTDALSISSRNQKGLFNTIRKNFDPKHKRPEDKHNIIITTDVLAEGINLHRANIVINYDVPWNSTRLMQRIGRVNRLGTKADNIYIYNFYPTIESDNKISLNATAISKLQGFHSAFSEDSQIYSDLEEMEDNILGKIETDEMNERDLRQDYLEFVRKFREENPKEFRRIKKLPLKTRVCRSATTVDSKKTKQKLGETPLANGTVAYIRNKARDAFYFSNGTDEIELTFLEAVQLFEIERTDKKGNKPQKMIKNHHAHVQQLIEVFERNHIIESDETLNEEDLAVQERNALLVLGQYAKVLKKAKYKDENLSADVKTSEKIIKTGIFKKFRNELAALRKDLIKRKKSSKGYTPEESIKKLQKIFDKYPIRQIRRMDELRLEEEAEEAIKARADKPEIILSESFI